MLKQRDSSEGAEVVLSSKSFDKMIDSIRVGQDSTTKVGIISRLLERDKYVDRSVLMTILDVKERPAATTSEEEGDLSE